LSLGSTGELDNFGGQRYRACNLDSEFCFEERLFGTLPTHRCETLAVWLQSLLTASLQLVAVSKALPFIALFLPLI